MNKWDLEVQESLIESEKEALKELEKAYKQAMLDVTEKLKTMQYDPNNQSNIYRRQHQMALRKQIAAAIVNLQSNTYKTIDQFLSDTYDTAYVGAMYEMGKPKGGLHLIQPIDRNASVKAILTDSKISKGLYNALGVDAEKLKKAITHEITRGIASDMPYPDIAARIADRARAPLSRAKVIARTEGHRIQQASQDDARREAKKKGADVVKQWDATLDSGTRPTHRRLDGQIREIDEPFEMDGKKAMYPGKFGRPEEDCNCRCVALTRARWALDEEELNTMKERAKFFGLDKTEDFKEYKRKYLKAAEEIIPETDDKRGNLKGIDAANKRAEDALLKTYKKRIQETGVQLVSAEDFAKMHTVDFTGIDPRAAEASEKVIEKYAGKYNSWIGGVQVANNQPYGVGGVTETSSAGGTAIIEINAKMMQDYDKMIETIRQNGQDGHGIKVKEEYLDQYILTHEYAHTLLQDSMTEKSMVGVDNAVYKKAMKEAKKVFKDYQQDYHDLSNKILELKREETRLSDLFSEEDADIVDILTRGKTVANEIKKAEKDLADITISRYANSDIDEFIAEAWTEKEIGENPGKYSQAIGDIIDKYFKF